MSRYNGDSYRPVRGNDGHSREPRPGAADTMYHFGSKQRPRKDFSFRSRIAERDLLTHAPPAETPVLGSNRIGDRFRDVENLTDSEEEAMDEGISDDDDHEASRTKKRRLENDSRKEPVAKWSNPDPYTALPPAQDITGKRVDVVRMIRKARNDALPQDSLGANEDDFISFDDLGSDYPTPPASAPSGPRADREKQGRDTTAHAGRKRKREDYESDELVGRGSGRSFHANGSILAEWRSAHNISPTPWLEKSSPTDSPMVALHKEILDFYAWVKPRDFEADVREELISRLEKELRRYKAGCQVRAFGSYAAGLYLPTGDMDLVCLVANSRSNMMPVSKNEMFKISAFLQRSGLVRPGSMQVIPHAKVPILKFVDHATGLKVDLSFNNTTGTSAIDTFKKWQVAYPAVPIIVAVVKQFLMIRGLNDNSIGGLGGFATICMVTSLIQNLPGTSHQNLGELLIEFFNLYGNLFDVRSVGVRMDPPGYIDKWNYDPLPDEKPDRLLIIDPNRPENNITGGSNQVLRIFDLFSRTHEILQGRLDDFADPSRRTSSFSFLQDLVGGNFSAYYQQRRMLHSVYAASCQTTGNPAIPPPPSLPPQLPPPPPPPPETNGVVEKTQLAGHKISGTTTSTASTDTDMMPQNKAEKRLQRLRRLCPELLHKLEGRSGLSKTQAQKVGAWGSLEEMNRDLDQRQTRIDRKKG